MEKKRKWLIKENVVVWRTNGKVEPRYGKGRDDLEINVKLLR